jgi:hypothetical protein
MYNELKKIAIWNSRRHFVRNTLCLDKKRKDLGVSDSRCFSLPVLRKAGCLLKKESW